MDQDRLLRSATEWQKKTSAGTPRLGLTVQSYLSKKDYQLRKNAAVVDIWQQMLPEEFYEHCNLVGVSGGAAIFEVDPGPYMHEMQALKQELLEYLQTRCPRAGIKTIKLYAKRNKDLQKKDQK